MKVRRSRYVPVERHQFQTKTQFKTEVLMFLDDNFNQTRFYKKYLEMMTPINALKGVGMGPLPAD